MHTVKFFNNAFSSTMIVNKNEGSQEMFALKKSCSPNSSFISNTGIISADKRLISLQIQEKSSAVTLLMAYSIFVLQCNFRAQHGFTPPH